MPRAAKDTKPAGKPRTAPAGKRERKKLVVKPSPPAPVFPELPRLTVPSPPRIQTSGTITLVTPTFEDFDFGTATATITAAATTAATNLQIWFEDATTTMNDTWGHWVTSANSTTGNHGTAAWIRWCDEASATHNNYTALREQAEVRAIAAAARGHVSPEERARREAQERLYAEEQERRIAAHKEANRKAEVLLRSVLTPDQIRDLESKSHFFMRDKNGLLYRIDRGQHGNVKLLDDQQQVVESYCIQPRGGLPDADAMVAQKLLLESDPESFRQISNITRNGARVGREALINAANIVL